MKLIKFILPLIALFLNIGCGNAQQNATSVVKNLTTAEFVEKYKSTKEAVLMDVRTPGEWAQGNLNNAVKCDFNATDFKQNAAKMDKTKPVFVYCAAGGRSAKAAKILEELGFSKVFNLKGAGNSDLMKAMGK